MLDGCNASGLEKLIGIIVDQLTVDEHVALVCQDLVHLYIHPTEPETVSLNPGNPQTVQDRKGGKVARKA